MRYISLFTMPYAQPTHQGDMDIEYGTSVKNSVFKDGIYYRPSGQLWCCPVCAEAWMMVSVMDDDNNFSRYFILTHECEYCDEKLLLAKTRIILPGSILMEGYNTIDELSVEMLRRELLLELKAMKLLIDKGVL